MNTAIIVAAGTGSRIDPNTPKQFLTLRGKPVIIHTLERFEHCIAIDKVVLVLPRADLERFRSLPERYGLKKVIDVVGGGETRNESVRNGLAAAPGATEIIVIHDGARPLVSDDEIERTVEAAKADGAACLVAPVTDTIKKIENGRIEGTLDRTTLRRALTPQAFRLEVLTEAFSEAPMDETVTDECMLVEKRGLPVAIVEGSGRNIKITHAEDLVLAEALLGEMGGQAGGQY